MYRLTCSFYRIQDNECREIIRIGHYTIQQSVRGSCWHIVVERNYQFGHVITCYLRCRAPSRSIVRWRCRISVQTICVLTGRCIRRALVDKRQIRCRTWVSITWRPAIRLLVCSIRRSARPTLKGLFINDIRIDTNATGLNTIYCPDTITASRTNVDIILRLSFQSFDMKCCILNDGIVNDSDLSGIVFSNLIRLGIQTCVLIEHLYFPFVVRTTFPLNICRRYLCIHCFDIVRSCTTSRFEAYIVNIYITVSLQYGIHTGCKYYILPLKGLVISQLVGVLIVLCSIRYIDSVDSDEGSCIFRVRHKSYVQNRFSTWAPRTYVELQHQVIKCQVHFRSSCPVTVSSGSWPQLHRATELLCTTRGGIDFRIARSRSCVKYLPATEVGICHVVKCLLVRHWIQFRTRGLEW